MRCCKGLRRVAVRGGIAHAFNGSEEQAGHFVALGFKLGFGGAMTYERALQIRRLAATLPEQALVLETDAPDIPPHWLYRNAQQRAAGAAGAQRAGRAAAHRRRRWPRCAAGRLQHTADVTTRQCLRRAAGAGALSDAAAGPAAGDRAAHAAGAAGQLSRRGVAGRRPVLRPSAQPVLAAAVGAAGRGSGARCPTRSGCSGCARTAWACGT